MSPTGTEGPETRRTLEAAHRFNEAFNRVWDGKVAEKLAYVKG
jgi:hypothetical protein